MKYARQYLFFSLLFFVLTQTGIAQVSMTLPDTTGTKPDTMQIPVRVSDLTGLNVIAAEIAVNYNPNVVQALGINQTGTLTSGWTKQTHLTSGRITVALANSSPASGSGNFLYIRFRLLPSAHPDSTFLTFYRAQLNEGEPAVSTVNGKIRILAIHINPRSGNLFEGDMLQFSATGDTTTPIAWGTTNSAVATIDGNGLLTALSEGFCQVTAEDAAGLTDTTDFIIVRPIQLRDLTLSVHDTSYTQQLAFDLPVYISNVNALGIISAQFQLHFNPTHLTPLEVITAGTMTEQWSIPEVDYQHDYLSLALAGSEALADSGKLIYVRFRVRPTASGTSQLSVSDVLFNEDIFANTVSGTFTPLPAPSIIIAPDHPVLTMGDAQQFTVSGGTSPYTWSTTDTSVANIDDSGLLTTHHSGAVRVVVEDIEAFTDTSGIIQVNDLKVSLPDTTIPQGYLLDVPVFVDRDVTQFEVISYEFGLSYLDTSALYLDSVITTGTLSDGWSNIAVKDSAGMLNLAAANSLPLSGIAPLIKLRFYSTMDAPIGLVSDLIFTRFLMNEGSPSATIVNGSLEVSSSVPNVTVYLPDTSAVAGSSIQIPVFTDQPVNGLGIMSYEFVVTYDDAVLTATGASNSGTISSGFTLQVNTNTPGTINVSAAGSTELSGTGTIVYLEFDVNADATGTSNLEFSSFQFNEGDPNAITYNGLFSVESENQNPVAVNDTVATDEDTPIVLHVLQNDYDPDGDPLTITDAHTTDSGGNVVIDAGDTTLTFTPGENFTGHDAVLYTISDGNGGTDQAEVYIQINPVNDPPGSFSLVAPPDSTTLVLTNDNLNESLTISWGISEDVDGDEVSYGFLVPSGNLDLLGWADTLVTQVVWSYNTIYSRMQASGVDIISGDWTILATDGIDTTYASNGSRYLVIDATTVGIKNETVLPAEFELFQNYPNPFNPVTVIKYTIPEQTQVTVTVYDLLGNKIATLVNQNQPAGFYTVEWNGRNDRGREVSAGFYLCRLYSPKYSAVRKMVFMK